MRTIPRQTDEKSEHRPVRVADSKLHNKGVHQSSSNRRAFLRTIGSVAAVGVVAGCLGDIGTGDDDGDYSDSFDENGDPEYDGWFDDVDTYDGTVDVRDEDEIVVAVGANGGLAFDPAAILIESGMTVVWEWTGDGGQHNVVHVDDAFESDLTGDAGHTFDHTFDESGIYRYVCEPHRQAGMKGAIAVSDAENDEAENDSSSSSIQ